MKDTQAAFTWIVDVLRDSKTPFLISGGLAARLHGSPRELADIDIEIPKAYFPLVADRVKPHIVYGPAQYRDENWDIYLMTLEQSKQLIDISAIDGVLLYDAANEKWVNPEFDIQKNSMMEVYGRTVPVTTRDELIRYKKIIARPVDLQDLAFLDVAGRI